MPALWINDGQHVVARLYGREGAFEAVLTTGGSRGTLVSIKAAHVAVWEARAI